MKEAADKKKYKVPFWKTVKKHWMLLAMLAPAVIYVVIFAYIQSLAGSRQVRSGNKKYAFV